MNVLLQLKPWTAWWVPWGPARTPTFPLSTAAPSRLCSRRAPPAPSTLLLPPSWCPCPSSNTPTTTVRPPFSRNRLRPPPLPPNENSEPPSPQVAPASRSACGSPTASCPTGRWPTPPGCRWAAAAAPRSSAASPRTKQLWGLETFHFLLDVVVLSPRCCYFSRLARCIYCWIGKSTHILYLS